MSASREQQNAAFGTFGDLNLAIIGLGVEYPPFSLDSSALGALVKRHYPESPA
jgi:fungal type III polyketide synthase